MRAVKLTLVSASPRRRELLAKLNFPFEICPSHVSEQWNFISPTQLAERNALLKVERSSFFEDRSRVLLGADTVVALKDRIFGKPQGESSAKRMLTLLSGEWHEVVTGICLSGYNFQNSRVIIQHSTATQVRFHTLTSDQIDKYLKTGEWHGKAGAYGIQGLAGKFVAEMKGDYENVVGLSTEKIKKILDEQFSDCNFL